MDISFHLHHNAPHQREHGRALANGMVKHGATIHWGTHNVPPANADIAVVWSWKQHRLIEEMHKTGRHVLVMERGFLPDRMQWCSLQWDGFNGRAHYVPAPKSDKGKRFSEHFGDLYQKWSYGGEYALLIGQVPGDAAVYGRSLDGWAQEACDRLINAGYKVRYRPHPVVAKRGMTVCPIGAELSDRTLAEDLEDAKVCVTFNSTTGVESVLKGVPTIAMDEGSMVWDFSSHSPEEALIRPNRMTWRKEMAWRQWQLSELHDGTAWEHVKQYLEG